MNLHTTCSYYTNGENATVKDFTDVQLLDKFISIAATTAQIVQESLRYPAELWLGETSSCIGGAPGLSDTYIAGFM